MNYIQKLLKEAFDADIEQILGLATTKVDGMKIFEEQLRIRLEAFAVDPDVVGFKSIVCYRTGLDVQVAQFFGCCLSSFVKQFEAYRQSGTIRLANKTLNDYVVTTALEVAAKYQKPGKQERELWLDLIRRVILQCSFIPDWGITILLLGWLRRRTCRP